MVHNPKTHKHFSLANIPSRRMQVYTCLADGCKHREERKMVIPVIIGRAPLRIKKDA